MDGYLWFFSFYLSFCSFRWFVAFVSFVRTSLVRSIQFSRFSYVFFPLSLSLTLFLCAYMLCVFLATTVCCVLCAAPCCIYTSVAVALPLHFLRRRLCFSSFFLLIFGWSVFNSYYLFIWMLFVLDLPFCVYLCVEVTVLRFSLFIFDLYFVFFLHIIIALFLSLFYSLALNLLLLLVCHTQQCVFFFFVDFLFKK